MEVIKDAPMLFTETYKGKKIFLTGHTGFKGSWLLVWLHQLGAKVKGYSLAPEKADDLYHQLNGDSLCESVIADIMDYERLEKELLAFEPDFIFHLAAQPLVRLSYEKPVETFAINSIGTAHVLQALARLNKPCNAVMITTDKVYHNNEWIYPYRETDQLGGYDPYSASKACAELVINSYRNSFFNINEYDSHWKAVAVARAGNVIGGGDWARDRIIPDIVRALRNGQPVSVRNPRSVRPWQHVLEPLGGYLLLGHYLSVAPYQYSTAYNFGPFMEDNMEVEDLVKVALEIWQEGTYEVQQLKGQPHEAGLLRLDISKAINELKWKPKLNAAQAVERTINWYKEVSSGKMEAYDLVRRDIERYVTA
ncbi:CDP-glucose 4,6-dehydratase [Chitinophaga tropicalis]|uniref:CDP-glucose 4,6-dehydratase n=1 Tax=Chitinophaga tropicalis TaxID=2683588 RepID=A0A7K1U0D2_9BACT|nr:CDP-glucose 4,6-dehydratase [Chitinophaga tropicalis]MVT07435.1 CDP-glucose 4,6-dehydratase [Chitinophaga tropicalis]